MKRTIAGLILSVAMVMNAFVVAPIVKANLDGSILFSEDFESSIIGSDGTAEGLVRVEPFLLGAVVDDGSGNLVYELDSATGQFGASEGPLVEIGNLTFANGEISMTITNLQGDIQVAYALILFRLVEVDIIDWVPSLTYMLVTDDITIVLYKIVDGEAVIESEVPSSISGDQPYNLKISAMGGSIDILINDEVVISVTDTEPIPEGKIWFGTDAGAIWFDNITVTTVLEPTPATLEINPDTLNLKAKGKYLTAYIELAEGYSVTDINVASLQLLAGTTAVLAELCPTEVGDHDGDGVDDLMVKFNRSLVQAAVSPGAAELTIFGYLVDGTPFEGSETIKVIDQGKEHTNESDPSSVEQG